MRVNGLYEDAASAEIYRRQMEDRLSSSTFLRSPSQQHDPIITPIVTGWAASLGFSATVSAFIGSAVTALATTAISIGLQMLLAPKPPKPEDGKIPKTQSVPYRWWGVGRVRVAGAYVLWESRGNKLYAVQAIAGHRIKSVNRYWLHDDEVTIDGSGVTVPNGSRYRDRVSIFHRLGLVPETPYSDLVDAFADEAPANRAWTSDHRGDGQASTAMIAKATKPETQAKRFPYGPPSLSVEADMAFCWDYRDPLQDPEDPSTWTWTQNTALQMCWHQCFNEFGHKRDYRRAILPLLDMWKEEADICDEDVALAGGGTEKRYQSNGFDTTENDPKVATNALLAACDGWICERGDGALLFIVGKFREKYVTTITDADIVGHQVQYDVLFEDEINRLVPKFTYPAIDYATSDTDFFEDQSAQLIAGRVLAQDANYQWVHQWRQARRLGKRDWLRLQEKVSGALDLRLSAINAVYTRWVRLQTPLSLPRLSGKLVENRKSTLALLQGGFNMEIVQHPENIDAWTPATDEGRQPPVPPKPNVDDIITPVINLVQAKADAGTVYIRVVIIDPDDDSLTPMVRYRVADTDGLGTPGAWVEKEYPDATPAGGYISLNTDVVPNDKLLNIQVAFMTSKGQGDWSPSIDVVSVSDPTAPQALASFTQTAAVPHLGNAVFAFTTKNDGRVKTVGLYRVATGAAFNPSALTPIFVQSVTASLTYGYTDGDPTRVMLASTDYSSTAGLTFAAPWAVSGGKATRTASASNQDITQAPGITSPAGKTYRGSVDIDSISGSNLRAVMTGGTAVFSIQSLTAPGADQLWTIAAGATGNVNIGIRAGTATVCTIDNFKSYEASALCAPQGVWDYYAVPFNGSGVAGPASGPVTVRII